MVKILIIYDSRTGNTEKMAQAVAEGARQIKDATVNVKKVDETDVSDLPKADAIVFGSPTYFGEMSGRLKAFIDESVKIYGKLEGKVGAAFPAVPVEAHRRAQKLPLLSIIQAMLIHGMIVQGRSSDKHYGTAAVEEPKNKDIESCKDLGKRVAKLAAKLSG